jgi:hypothetical protein
VCVYVCVCVCVCVCVYVCAGVKIYSLYSLLALGIQYDFP